MQKLYLFLADFILITHATIVLFIVGGFIAIWVGHFRDWSFARNFYFRGIHLVAMGYVTVQTILGEDCPLTVWENDLRVNGGATPIYEGSFIGHWLGKILFYEIDAKIFLAVYTLFFALVVATLFLVKPRSPRKRNGRKIFSPDDAGS